MRVEDFDSKLRQKISHLEPEFQEKDWLRFQQKMQAGDRTPWKRYLLLLLLLFTIGGIAFTLRHRSPFIKEETLIQKSDILADAKDWNGEQAKSAVSVLPMTGASNEMKTNENSGFEINNKHSKGIDQKSTGHPSHLNKKTSAQLNTTKASEIQNSEKPVPVIISAMDQQEATATSIQEELLVEKLQLLSPTNMFSEIVTHPVKPDLKIQKHSGIDKWAAGFNLTMAKEHTSFGGMIERKTNSNISFRSGILYQNFFEKEYQNEIAFKQDNQVAFTEIAKPRHSTTEEFSNIRIKSSEVVCPIELKYTMPFSSKMAAYVFGGLQLTLQSKTVLDFDYLNHFTNQYLTESGLDQASNSSTLINNFGFGAGIQRNFGGLQWSIAGVMQKSNSNLPHIAKRSWGMQAGVSLIF